MIAAGLHQTHSSQASLPAYVEASRLLYFTANQLKPEGTLSAATIFSRTLHVISGEGRRQLGRLR